MKKIQHGFRRLIAVAIALFAAGAAALSSSAATLYTNTWANTAGVGTVKNWGDAANWSVTYEPDVTPPASAVPTGESFVKLQSNASITLQPGDDYSVGQTYFLAGTTWKTLNMEIPTGSRLSLVGSDLVGTGPRVTAGLRMVCETYPPSAVNCDGIRQGGAGGSAANT